MLSEVSQTERQIPHDFTYVRNLTNKINEQTNQRQTHRYRERNDGRQMERGMSKKGEWDQEVRIVVIDTGM